MKCTLGVLASFCLAGLALAGDSATVGETMLGPAETTLTASGAPPECPQSWRAVRLKCRGGAEGLVAGVYGGTDFFLTCGEDAEICTSGNAYRYIMEGATPTGPAVRCASSGDEVQVNDICGPLHLIIN